MARAHDLSDILNPNYKPATPTEIALFSEQQKFMYAVLDAKVETAKGKSILRTYEASYDAQKAYADLKDYHLTSNSALFGVKNLWNILHQLGSTTDRGMVLSKIFYPLAETI
jgi:hypothetical protein